MRGEENVHTLLRHEHLQWQQQDTVPCSLLKLVLQHLHLIPVARFQPISLLQMQGVLAAAPCICTRQVTRVLACTATLDLSQALVPGKVQMTLDQSCCHAQPKYYAET